MSEPSKAVLITGCSSGIGEATARRLAKSGWTVYATARRPEAIEHLASEGCRTLELDVTSEDSMRTAVEEVERTEGAVGVLVNNAGYSQGGSIEQVPMEAIRRQFETNVFGLVALTQLVLGGMRDQRFGKVVNVGSMGGRLTFPGAGFYHATKHALEAISDAARFELRGFGVDVILVEPGLIKTEYAKAAVASYEATPEEEDDGPYSKLNRAVQVATVGAYEGALARLGGGPEVVAKAIEKAISRRRAPSRVLVTPSARLALLQRRLLSDRAWDSVLRTQFPQPK
jgi:NAD(P)-dependent dehydrogenase (short-subunit alcohol dehydrogenase family)